MKNRYAIFGIILVALGLIFIAIALTNPQMSFPWSNWVSYTLYGFYIVYTVLVFCMPRLEHASIIGCVILALEFIALGLIVISIGVRTTPNDYNWYLPAGLSISAFAQFLNLFLVKRRKKGYKG